MSLTRTVAILEVVMEVTGSDIADVEPAVRSTEETLHGGSPTEGASVIREVLGDDVGQKVLDAIDRILRAGPLDETTSIVMEGGKLVDIVDRAESALIHGDSQIYQRGGVLIHPIKLAQVSSASVVDDVQRELGATVLAAVREPWLTEQMSRTAKWYRKSGDDYALADPRPIYARTLLSRGEWKFRGLRAVLTAPTLDRDGRVVEEPGFDPATGLLLDIKQGTFPPMPTAPTRGDAEAALALLTRPLRAFPFVSDEAKSVAISAMLTALVRLALRSSPLHGFDAPTAGTGKSLLAELVGLLATGVRPPAMSQGKSQEEDEKRLSTVLFAGDPVIHIDNCERALSGDFLCSMLTQEVVQARILGYSERRVLPSTALVLASGNNLTCLGDVSRRAVICRLDAQVERPDTRQFDFDCQKEVLAQRAELVVAGLTILRAFVHAGRPVTVKPMGSFDDWAWVRGALVWLDCADPAETRQFTVEGDPRKDELHAVMQLWEMAFGNQRTSVASINKGDESLAASSVTELRDKLTDVACRRGSWSGKSVGWWLRRHKDQIVGGRCFKSVQGRDGLLWWLEPVSPRQDTSG